MPLAAGTRFGSFEILSLLGAGGMGEVYRSRDSRLNRDVALKILPDLFANDPDRLARFRREAQMLAALNHPNVAAIHGLEDEKGRHALVLELVEGPTLADRIVHGALPLDEALPIAKQIVDALEAAHEQGIIHRDLKPANIKVRDDGTVKVLDFGLAKAMSRTEQDSSVVRPDVTASPTLLSPATMTSAGVILGTAAYMAPEQARGKAVDHRADIWAFGCVLYEMLTGRRAFDGDEVSDTLAGILRGNPEWNALSPSTPHALRRLLRRCLEKNPRERLQAIGDARLDIADALRDGPEKESAATTAAPRRSFLPLLGAVAATALIVASATWALKPATSDSDVRVTRALIDSNAFDHRPPAKPGEARAAIRPDRTSLALSPDGRILVFRGIAVDVNPGGGTQSVLFVRSLDSLTATPIATTTGADSPFFSPDGAWIGYWDGGELRRVPVAGSTTYTTIARVPGEGTPRIAGVTWGDDDTIVFSTGGDLWSVSASGGSPKRIVQKRDDEYALKLPHLLPGGKTVLFTRQSTNFRWDDARIVARSLATGEQKVLLEDAADARYMGTGHLVFMRRGKLMAVPFDPQNLTLRGGAVALVDDVMQAANMGNTNTDSGAGQFAISDRGTLVYATGGIRPDDQRELVWVSRDGKVEPIPAPKREWVGARLSPDSQKIVTFTSDFRVWVYDIARGTLTPLTSQQERGAWGTFSPDGTRVVFQSVLAGRSFLVWKVVDGNDKAEQLDPNAHEVQTPNSWSRDDKIAFVQGGDTTRGDIWVFDARTRKPSPLIHTEANELHPAFSPDGKWLAYVSDLTGGNEVYVQAYPDLRSRVLVSNGGGRAPAWGADSGELFYTANQGNAQGLSMMSVKLTPSSSGLSASVPQKLFEGQYAATTPGRAFDVTSDGRRFLMIRRVDSPPPPPSQVVLVQNFSEELKRRVHAQDQNSR